MFDKALNWHALCIGLGFILLLVLAPDSEV